MDVDLFGKHYAKIKPISLSIYADEIKKYKNRENENWFYIGILLIPEEKKKVALEKLNIARKESCYDRELHFSSLSNYSYAKVNNEKTLLAKKWLDLLFKDKNDSCYYFTVLGINYSKINLGLFGTDKRELFQNIYNRFFRTAIKSSLSYFFSKKTIIIENIFHDNENHLAKHIYFDWHCINKLNEEMENISFSTDCITFIDSDHNKEVKHKDEAHFIQLIDIILGSIRLGLDDTTIKDGCCEIAEEMCKLLERMMRKPGNKNSRYGYYRKYSVSFFPSQRLNSEEILDPQKKIISKIYNNRRMLFADENQMELF